MHVKNVQKNVTIIKGLVIIRDIREGFWGFGVL